MKIYITTNTMNVCKVAVRFIVHFGCMHCRIRPFSAPEASIESRWKQTIIGRVLVPSKSYLIDGTREKK